MIKWDLVPMFEEGKKLFWNLKNVSEGISKSTVVMFTGPPFNPAQSIQFFSPEHGRTIPAWYCTCSANYSPLLSFGQLLLLLLLLHGWGGRGHLTVRCQGLKHENVSDVNNRLGCKKQQSSVQTEVWCDVWHPPQLWPRVCGSPSEPPGSPWPTRTECMSWRCPGWPLLAPEASAGWSALFQQSWR